MDQNTMTTQQMLHERMAKRLGKRHRREKYFKYAGLFATCLGLAFVAFLFVSILSRGIPAFWQSTITIPVYINPELVKLEDAPMQLQYESAAAFKARQDSWRNGLMRVSWNSVLVAAVKDLYPEETLENRDIMALFTSSERYQLRDLVAAKPELIGQTVPLNFLAHANVDVWLRGNIDRDLPDVQQQLSPQVRALADRMAADGYIQQRFSKALFLNTDSRSSAASAGLSGAFMGSLFMMIIVLLLAVPVGVASAIYLEEFAPENFWTNLVEVNINNLAAVPSIVFGLLGAALLIGWFKLPLSAPLVGGLVLSLMALPTVIIATRAALQAVPISIRNAALGVGASKVQMVFHHVLPLALPGVLTGAILAVAQALGETAPLLLIGMNAFVANVPSTPMDQASALPVQIFLWQGNELRNFFEARTSAAIIVLLAMMLGLNLFAVWLRKRLEKRW